MEFDIEYIESSMDYPVWKTRFLEGFCPIYRANSAENPDKSARGFVFLNLFTRMTKIIKKRLKEEHSINTLLPVYAIIEGEKFGYVKNKDICLEIIDYAVNFYNDKSFCVNFKDEYFKVLADFYEKFSNDVKFAKNRAESQSARSNKAFFGLKKVYYNEIIEKLKKIKSVKIVRIFGSRNQGICREFSDIDAIFEGTYTEKGFERIKKQLQSLKIPYFLDIYDVNYRLKPFIYRNTLRSSIFYKRSDYFEDDYISFLDM